MNRREEKTLEIDDWRTFGVGQVCYIRPGTREQASQDAPQALAAFDQTEETFFFVRDADGDALALSNTFRASWEYALEKDIFICTLH